MAQTVTVILASRDVKEGPLIEYVVTPVWVLTGDDQEERAKAWVADITTRPEWVERFPNARYEVVSGVALDGDKDNPNAALKARILAKQQGR